MSTAGPLETLARILGEALSPLAARLEGDNAADLMEQLGLRLPLGAGGVQTALEASVVALEALPDSVAALVAAISGSDSALIAAAADLSGKIIKAGTAFTQLATALNDVVQADGGLSAQQKAALATAAAEMPQRLLGLAIVSYLEDRLPSVKNALNLTGLLDDTVVPGDAVDPEQPPFHRTRLRLDRLGGLVSNPVQHLKDLYGFGRPNFDGIELFARLKSLVDRPEAEALLITAPGQPAVLEALLFRLAVQPGAVPNLRARLRMAAQRDVAETVPIGGPWSGTVSSTARFDSFLEFVIDPQSGVQIQPPGSAASVAASLGVSAANPDGSPLILIGQAGGSRLELQSANLALPLQISAPARVASPSVLFGATFGLKQGKLVIDASDGDSFIATLLGGVNVQAGFDLDADFDTQKGLRFVGSGTIQLSLPTHISLGPLTIPTLYLIGTFADAGLNVEFSADLAAQLGPLNASVQRLGALADISFPKSGGNAGPLQIDVSFKGPTGVGLSIDAAVVSGGGFLSIDTARGQYAGILQLTIADFLNVTAIGLIETKLPDGSNGFSLLIIITADFGEGIQLGFGFTLLAVGGLIGLNRGMLFQPLMDGVRTNAISSVLFPQDVIANATRIISDLQAIFPPVQGTFLIGPMAKIGWGVPTLASVSLGVIIEIPPGDIAILGVIRIALPADDVAILVLQVNFAGAIEVDKQRIYFFAALFNSHVLFITLDGSMGLLVAYGSDANFVVSVGGFHPLFNPPPLPFPPLQRISMNLINKSFARIHADGYFAVTSNTVQFGTQSNYFFGFSALNVQGASSFDALIQFSPFHFTVSFSTSFSVNIFGVGAFGIDIALTVSGPTPFHASGTASISFFFFSVGINIDFTWGDSRDTTLPPVSVMPLLTAELGKQSNWRALLPPGNTLLVTVRRLDPANAAQVLHPAGVLQFSQRVVPLDLTLAKFGNQTPSDADLFTLDVTSPDLTRTRNLQEPFAPAQFQNFDDAQKLSQPAYVPLDSGMELAVGGVALASGTAITRNVRYDLTIIDTKLRRVFVRFFLFSATLFGYFLNGGSVTRSPLSAYRKALRQPLPGSVTLSPETFAVALTSTNVVFHPEAASFTSQAAAGEFLARAVANDPTLAGTLHVLPRFEVAA